MLWVARIRILSLKLRLLLKVTLGHIIRLLHQSLIASLVQNWRLLVQFVVRPGILLLRNSCHHAIIARCATLRLIERGRTHYLHIPAKLIHRVRCLLLLAATVRVAPVHEFLPSSLQSVAGLRDASFTLFSQLLRPFHLLLPFCGPFICIHAASRIQRHS